MGMLYFVCNCSTEELTMRLYHIQLWQMQEVWRIFAREYFGVNTPEELEKLNAKVAPFADLMIVFLGNREQLFPFMRKIVEEHLLK